ncbi:MAG: thiamine pyrophosphate-binding protein [Thermodesulfobacteriota bacterium]|nr:thiamine pyrophosphate-binding protein [Thermodesulfobacteriota bacterium]
MAKITGGELLLKCLHAEGIRHIHAITDGTYMMVIEAIERLGEELGIRLIVPRHEAAAAHACDAYTRIAGEPAVVMACAGPGAANLIAGILCAQAEGSPVVAITTTRRSEIADAYMHQGGMQVSQHLDVFRQAVKWNGKVDHWSRIPDMVRHAFRIATAGRPGPTHILIPEDIIGQKGEEESIAIWRPEKYRLTKGTPADPADVHQAAEMLVKADLVNIHCGNGAERAGAGSEVQELAEYLGCPLTATIRARGIISDEHKLCFHPTCMSRIAANGQADVVLAVGTRLGELNMWGRPPMFGEPDQQRLIQIDTDPTSIGLNRPVDIPLVGDARKVLIQLIEAVKGVTKKRSIHAKVAEFRMIQDEWQKELDEAVADMALKPMLTGHILKVCNKFFDEDAIFVMDGGNTTLWDIHYHIARRQRSVLYSMHYGHLGTGLPYAIGAKLANPERTVYCVTGDSAFGFNIQELETAVRNQLPVIIIVAVDGAYGMEKTAQLRQFGREADWFGHDHAPVRYDQVGVAMGCHGEYVETANEILPALERSVASAKPAVIHAVVDPDANVDPPGNWLWAAARTGKM